MCLLFVLTICFLLSRRLVSTLRARIVTDMTAEDSEEGKTCTEDSQCQRSSELRR